MSMMGPEGEAKGQEASQLVLQENVTSVIQQKTRTMMVPESAATHTTENG